MVPNSKSTTKKIETMPTPESLLLAVLAGLVVFNFRWDMHGSLLILCAESFFYLSIPTLILFGLQRRLGPTPPFVRQRQWVIYIQIGAFLFALLPILIQYITRQFGFGDPFEVLALCIMMNATWYLAVFSKVQGFGRLAFILGSCLVLFVCFMTQSAQSFVFAFLYLAISLWWLLGNYWEQLESKAIDGESRSLPARGLVVVLTFAFLIVIGTIAMALGPMRTAVGLKGFMPSSGGDSWHDTYARSGIGDGDMLTAGEDASTSGAVDSDQMIEDDKPSIYDIMSEKYDGPVKQKIRKNRAQSLDGIAKHMHNVVQSEQSGRSFRTVRKRPVVKDLDLQNRITKALFFVEGEVPARFGIDSFYHFDGWDWTKPDLGEAQIPNPTIQVQRKLGKPWYVLLTPRRQFLTAKQVHRVKIMRLQTASLTAPPFLKSWHIHRVEDTNLFEWDSEGSVVMDGGLIPSHTMIDIVSAIPNHYILGTSDDLTSSGKRKKNWLSLVQWFGVSAKSGNGGRNPSPLEDDPESPYLQVPQNSTKPRLQELLDKISQNQKPGWKQVDAIVNHLRNHYELDASRVASPECDDSIQSFLDQKGGPSYQFATTATQLLRLAGYRTRIRSGFLVQPKDYSRISRQSVVDSSNLHMWPEICIDGMNWIPVEPTPGYPIPCNTQTFWQWTKVQIANAINWAVGHPLTSIFYAALFIFIIIYRNHLVVFIAWIAWRLTMIGIPNRRLRLTRQLLDLRFWAAGIPRPSFEPITHWYSQIDPDAASDFISQWQEANFSNQPRSFGSSKTKTACKQAVDLLTYRRIRHFANQTNS
ncbi:MAG: transglutaminase-like domain-containing protein [Mariniblastus sp.]|nr:transglutaminase-like domain-containing protein [Mariniblastus sp.]